MTCVIQEDWEPRSAPDIYLTRAYMAQYGSATCRPMRFEYTEGSSAFYLPYLESMIHPYLPEAGTELRDMETAYGYGGCWTNCTDPGFLASAMRALENCCRERNIVAGFLRFHPLLGNHGWAPGFRVSLERQTINVDLTDADIWKNQVSQKNRNMIRKAERESLSFHIDEGFHFLGDFQRLYGETMLRLGADASYRFPDRFFRMLPEALGANGFLVHCRYRDEIISSAVIMTWGKHGHYHLSGSKREFQALAPNNLMLYQTIVALKARGLENFHLGGGTTPDSDDPLFKFKKAFSGNLRQFHIGRRVFLEKEYDRLKAIWTERFPEKITASGSKILFYRF